MWPSRPPVASKNGVVPPRSYYGVYNAEVFLGRYNNSFEYNLHEKIVTSSKVEILKRLAPSWKKIFFYKNQ